MILPELTIIAGANGSGKTTLTHWNSDVFRAIPVLDPDMIARTLQSTSTAAPIAAARQVLSSAREHIRKAKSFAVETTLAGKHYLQMMADARSRGFVIVLVYIGTESVEINLVRIRNRVLAGGHNVPEQDVRRTLQEKFCEPSNGQPRSRAHHPVRQFNRRGLPARRSSRRVGRSVVQTHPGLGRPAGIAIDP